MCRTTFMPSGIRLQQLIQNQYKEILAREKNNDKFIHLYDIGAYWVAFERSACRLSGLFSKSELTLFRVPDCVEYVVMVSVPADEAEGCLGEYIILHDGIYRKVWSEHVLPMGDYRHWHEMAVRSVYILLFSMEYGHPSCSIGNTLKNPSKASACSQTPCSWAFRLKDWVQESFSWGLECFSRTDLPPILRESFF